MKHKLFLLLAAIGMMVPQVASAYDFEVDGFHYDILGTDAVKIIGSQKCEGSVVIPSTVTYSGTIYNVTSIGLYAFSGCSGLTSLTIPNSVTSIGSHAFYGCSGLASITIPNSVTSIGGDAFSGCSGLTSITIPNSVTSIADFAFCGCSGLTSVTIPNSVTSIRQYAFVGCSGLTSITIPNSVTSIGYSAFKGCSGLTSIIIPNSVTSIGGDAFSGCSGVKKLIYADGCTTALCTYLTSITSVTIPNSVTSIDACAFFGCSGLTSLTIPNSVTSIGEYAFKGCSGLTSITIPNSVTSIGTSAFRDCRLTSVTNKALVPQTIDGSTFTSYCKLHVIKGYKEVYASKSLWNLFTIVDDVPFTKLTSITLDKDVYTCAVGGAETASVGSYLPEDATINSVTWSATNPGIIFIDATTGQFVGLADGETTITATAVDGSGVTASAIVKVGSAAEGIVSEILDETSSTRLINLNGQYTTDAQHGVILQKKGHGIAKKVLRK